MGEIKSVKVDNWGVFFLQKLQNFFNKTDFCDLTLQFKDNSQLKVHRLVLSACTDFFNVLEQTCELMEDALVMPAELQADVVVPIVNFMYTGTLEFELKMYNKLLKTAKEMNMTVLLKLLEAHKRTMETARTINKVSSPMPKTKRITTVTKGIPQTISVTSAQQPQRRIQMPTNIPTRRGAMKPMQDRIGYKPSPNTVLRAPPQLQRGPIRFEEPNTHTETYESSFDSISYESKPMKEEPEDYFEVQASPRKRSSPFEQLRKGFNNNKRPAVATFTSPPAKKPNIEDVKEFSEQQRMRKQIAAEFNDDAEFDSIMDDEFHHDDDDEEAANVTPSPSSSNTASKQQPQNQQASIIIKQSPNEKPTIVVKDSSNSKMDHAKIISEVLRQYPHLVKSNKNIKLKIMPNIGGQSQKIIVKKETLDNMSAEMEQSAETVKTQARQQKTPLSQQTVLKKPLKSYASASTSNIFKVEPQPAATATNASKNTNETNAVPSAAPTPKRRIDSKTMHALIAQGAENTTGPWLCLRCGVNGRPISIPSYRGFRRHLINTHKETIDPALCEYCGWRSKNNRVLHHHILIEHKVASLLYTFPECMDCNKICLSEGDLQIHGEQYHPDVHKQQCIYCNKVFVKEMNLYTHMKTFHKRRAREDGVIDFSDDEMGEQSENEEQTTKETVEDTKIKILSDIALPSTLLKLEEQPSTMEEEYANDSGPKFVNAEGNEMLLTAEQREEIMSQLDQDHDGGVVMVLNESTFPPEDATEAIADDMKLKLETSDPADEFEDPNNEILTAEDTLKGSEITTTSECTQEENKTDETHEGQEQHDLSDHEERMDDEDHMEWAENLISAHDADDDDDDEQDNEIHDDKDTEEGAAENKNKNTDKTKDEEEKIPSAKPPKQEKTDPKKAEDINLKLKMLTGDWSDDEIDDDDEEERPEPDQDHKEKAEEPESSVQAVDDETEKSKPDDAARKLQQEAADEFENELESELEPEGSLIGEDELTQSSQSEKVEAKGETIKEVTQDEKLETSADSPKSAKPKKEELIESSTTSEEKKEEKVSEKTTKEGKTSRRTSDVKEDETNKTTTKDLSDEKVPSPSETQKADDDVVEKDDNKEDIELKSKPVDDVEEESVKSTKTTDEDSVKTPDKVKSLINEWADEDDDL